MLKAICAHCQQTVDCSNVHKHFEAHGLAEQEWHLATWPDDGTIVLFDVDAVEMFL